MLTLTNQRRNAVFRYSALSKLLLRIWKISSFILITILSKLHCFRLRIQSKGRSLLHRRTRRQSGGRSRRPECTSAKLPPSFVQWNKAQTFPFALPALAIHSFQLTLDVLSAIKWVQLSAGTLMVQTPIISTGCTLKKTFIDSLCTAERNRTVFHVVPFAVQHSHNESLL